MDMGNCSEFRPSGVMGSLRWWYDLLVMALGGYACRHVEQPCPDQNGIRCAGAPPFGAGFPREKTKESYRMLGLVRQLLSFMKHEVGAIHE